ncbi:MAG TPA: hypothetical protein VHB48_07985 [Chitinophagaceae bacterium]|nr:hypothetical protein [Chitinophagaceae bacterium]
MSRTVKEKLTPNVQVNFNKSTEVAYWSKKYNISQQVLQRVFEDNGRSISQTIAWCVNHTKRQRA